MVDGATRLQAFLRVLLPLSAPAIVAVSVFAFTAAWNELLFGLIFITSPDLQTVPVAISYLINGDVFRWGLIMAGSVLAGYAGLGVKMEYLLAASFMAIPGGLLFAKIIYPSTEESEIEIKSLAFDEHRPANVIEAAASGVQVGLQIAVNVGGMLIAFIGLIALINGMVGGFFGWFGHPDWTLEFILGTFFAPLWSM